MKTDKRNQLASFSSLTVGQFQELWAIQNSNLEKIDKGIYSISIITGKPREDVEEMDFEEFNRLAGELATIFKDLPLLPITHNRIDLPSGKYKLRLNFDYFKVKDSIRMSELINAGVVENLHLIVAGLLMPLRRQWLPAFSKQRKRVDVETLGQEIKAANMLLIISVSLRYIGVLDQAIKMSQSSILKKIESNKKAQRNSVRD